MFLQFCIPSPTQTSYTSEFFLELGVGIGCGWCSIVARPMTRDQFRDATLVVGELKLAKKVCEGGESVVYSDELGRVLTETVGGRGEELSRVVNLQEAAVHPVKDSGTSNYELLNLMEQLVFLF
ncbi:unnamed protein product [Vicia faba]|uniref:Uncharacterized protein n=1 Tax=Vicia faba TaxID=3906 RepID=A0AAV0YX39_VICFA|nr:unnamed protein product [Vicia faba]